MGSEYYLLTIRGVRRVFLFLGISILKLVNLFLCFLYIMPMNSLFASTLLSRTGFPVDKEEGTVVWFARFTTVKRLPQTAGAYIGNGFLFRKWRGRVMEKKTSRY